MPGLDFSNDPLLQGRLFSYLDTQLSRLGGPNFHQIPINRPKCPFANHQRDGHMQMDVPKGNVAYDPGSLAQDSPRESPAGFKSTAVSEEGQHGRVRAESFADHYTQARLFYRSQTEYEQAHIASALVFELSKLEKPHVRETMVGHLTTIDEGLGKRVAAGLGLQSMPESPNPTVPPHDLPPSPAVQIIGKMLDTFEGRVLGILVADGSDDKAVATLVEAATAAGGSVKIVAPKIGGVKLGNGSPLPADGQLAGTPSVLFDAVAIVLSEGAATHLSKEAAAIDFVRDAFGHLKAIGVDDGGRALLAAAAIDADEFVVDVQNTTRFMAIAKTRAWSREAGVRTLA